VSYPTLWVVTDVANITRAVQYDPIPWLFHDQGTAEWNLNPQLDMSAASQPYFSTSQDFKIRANASCPTPKCEWDPFDTLAICSACTPIRGLLERRCINATSVIWQMETNVSSVGTIDTCGWYLIPPGNQAPILVSGYAKNYTTNTITDLLVGRIVPLRNIFTRVPVYPNATINYPNILNPLADYIVAFSPDGIAGALAGMDSNAPDVNECVMHWCVQTVNATVTGSLLTETVTNERELNTDNVANPWIGMTEYLPHFSLTLPDKHSPNGTGTSTYGLGFMPAWSNRTARATLDVIQYVVPSSWTASPNTSVHDPNPQVTGKLFWPGASWIVNAPLVELPWASPHNITAHVAAWAATLTGVIRKTPHGGTNNYEQVQGRALNQRVIVRIRWLWIILPAILLGGSLAFLIATVVKSSREEARIGVWKSSALAVLFNGPGEDVQEAVGDNPSRLGSVREKAKNLRVTLREGP
jgi:hypothetical protein